MFYSIYFYIVFCCICQCSSFYAFPGIIVYVFCLDLSIFLFAYCSVYIIYMHLLFCISLFYFHSIYRIICILVYTYSSYKFIVCNLVFHFIHIMLGISFCSSQHMHLSLYAFIISLYASQSMHIILVISIYGILYFISYISF